VRGRPVAVAWPAQGGALRARWGWPRPRSGRGHETRGGPVPPLPLQGDEESLFAEHRVTLRRRVGRLVNTSDANVDASCSFAWMQLVRRQPRRETVLSWLTTVAVREAVRLDRRDRRDRRLVSSEDLPDRCRSLTHAEAFAALEVVASLPPRQRELIGLQVAGYSREEIAVLTGTSKPRGRTPPAPGARRIARRLGRATGAQALGLAPLLSVQPVSYQGRLVRPNPGLLRQVVIVRGWFWVRRRRCLRGRVLG
jgi:DNA-directed RNA polymerase specialized sigma24 family protein